MIENEFNRRDFLKVLGWGGAAVAVSGCGFTSVQDGVENVVSYVEANEYMIPGIGVYFNSTCAQCDAGCGISGKVREGRVLKLEGNAASSINRGRLCGLGQAGVQAHYNPDRVTEPRTGKGDKLDWEKALGQVKEKLNGVSGDEIAFLTGNLSGHLKVLLGNYMDALGSKNHFVYDAVAPAVVRASNKKAYGSEMPELHLDKAKVIVSFGADFLGSWVSPVNFSQQYGQFRKGVNNGGRGVLVQIEPKMTLTGANADRWIPANPGTEGVLALGLINALGAAGVAIPADIAASVSGYGVDRVSKDTGVSAEQIQKLATVLKERSPSLVIAGGGAEGYAHGSQNAAAVALLNQVLGNVGKTIEAPSVVPFPQLAPTAGGTAGLKAFNDGLAAGKFKVLFTLGTNPVYSAPAFMKLSDNLKKVAFKVALTESIDETAAQADLVLPLDSAMESWGSVVAEYQAGDAHIGIQQPLMERLYEQTRSAGDILLSLVKLQKAEDYKDFEDYYAYLRGAMVQAKGALGGAGMEDDEFWNTVLSNGMVKTGNAASSLRVSTSAITLPAAAAADAAFPLRLLPYVQPSFRDGRHANLPWLQESPDPLTTIVWDSWVEMHPKTATKLGIVEGDIVELTSKSGSIKAQAYIFPGIHPDAVSVPFGNGHTALGRYAKGVGANVFQMLDPVFDQETGELAMNETHVKISKTGQRVVVVKDEGAAGGSQAGLKIAGRLASNNVDLSKEV